MPMEDIDKNEVSDDGISDEEELLHREVIQGDADLYYLHHYLSEVFIIRKSKCYRIRKRNDQNAKTKRTSRCASFT